MSSRDDNIATQEKAAERLNAGDVDAGVDIMFAPDAVDHDPATGRRIEVRGLQLGRFSDGQIVERWGATDMATLMSQIQA